MYAGDWGVCCCGIDERVVGCGRLGYGGSERCDAMEWSCERGGFR